MNQKTILIAVVTFAVGLLTGVLVFPDLAPSAIGDAAGPGLSAPASAPELPSEPSPPSPAPMISQVVTEDDDDDNAVDSAASNSGTEPSIDLLSSRVDDISAGWGRMQADLADLRQRIAQLEQRTSNADRTSNVNQNEAVRRAQRPRTQQEQREALLRAGVTKQIADDIVWRRAEVSLERLELRDQATREGWFNTQRYREELRKVNEQRVSIRDEIGVDAYDRYLFETGQNNRVLVESVIPGSAGEISGLLPGDVIETYDALPMFDFRDLRSATSDGERGELVPVTVRRGDQQVELWLQRGPIGIGLDAMSADPSS
ncbi:MAG TPA: PDZ domain-containing protein [Chromatiaceae bacterium]|jgi:membrane-associated protease RseP (regulator of RpoE activity)|nr:MAG: hypothetical protein N838_27215 [Thiohalocapsa sp. PB-PSB1]QQO54338.1 MAG: PDZ domain-containing protein [Thiohalocapsa sp. PB-PSB1]HBG93759.1 PDZ domain-containing protein [Chromatiaceae bacterium]HCS90020.1 PDZ domain-containing protein [Chromatiaceae bacterium]